MNPVWRREGTRRRPCRIMILSPYLDGRTWRPVENLVPEKGFFGLIPAPPNKMSLFTYRFPLPFIWLLTICLSLSGSLAGEISREFRGDLRAATSSRAKALKSLGAEEVRVSQGRGVVGFSRGSSQGVSTTESVSKRLPVRFKSSDIWSPRGNGRAVSYVTAYLAR